MAFPSGWMRRCALTIQHGQVAADQSNFPVLVSEASLPSEMLTLGGANAAQSNGGDIRFSSDVAGATQLPCSLVQWTQNANPALAKAELWVKVANIFSATDVTIYVWYSAGGSQSQPAASDTYGSQNVWDANHKAVWHMADNAASTNIADSTSNANNGTAARNTSLTASANGKIDGAQLLNGSSDFFSVSSSTISTGSNFTVSMWFNKTDNPGANNDRIFALLTDANNGFQFITDATSGRYAANLVRGGVATINGVTYSIYDTGSLVHLAYTVSGSTGTFYRNGVSVANVGSTAVGAGLVFAYNVGRRPDGNASTFAKGVMDEVRLENTARSSTWILTGYNNQNSPSTFIIAGTPVSAGTPPEDKLHAGRIFSRVDSFDPHLGGMF